MFLPNRNSRTDTPSIPRHRNQRNNPQMAPFPRNVSRMRRSTWRARAPMRYKRRAGPNRVRRGNARPIRRQRYRQRRVFRGRKRWTRARRTTSKKISRTTNFGGRRQWKWEYISFIEANQFTGSPEITNIAGSIPTAQQFFSSQLGFTQTSLGDFMWCKIHKLTTVIDQVKVHRYMENEQRAKILIPTQLKDVPQLHYLTDRYGWIDYQIISEPSGPNAANRLNFLAQNPSLVTNKRINLTGQTKRTVRPTQKAKWFRVGRYGIAGETVLPNPTYAMGDWLFANNRPTRTVQPPNLSTSQISMYDPGWGLGFQEYFIRPTQSSVIEGLMGPLSNIPSESNVQPLYNQSVTHRYRYQFRIRRYFDISFKGNFKTPNYNQQN